MDWSSKCPSASYLLLMLAISTLELSPVIMTDIYYVLLILPDHEDSGWGSDFEFGLGLEPD